MDIFLYQIQYDDKTAASEDSGLLTFDCRKNPEFLKREIAHLIRFYDEVVVNANDDDYFGLFSPKFEQKTGLKIQQVKDFVRNNPNQDIYLFNPFPMLVYKHMNMWEQGELCHSGVLKIVDELFEKSDIGFKVSSLHRQNVKQVVYSNYWVGKKSFLDSFVPFLKYLDKMIEESESIKSKVFTHTLYDLSEACFYPFIFERVLSTYLCLISEIKSVPYEFEKNDIVLQQLNLIERIFYLSDLKKDFDAWELQNYNKVDEIYIKINVLKNFLRPKCGNRLIESIMRKINILRFNSMKKKILPNLE